MTVTLPVIIAITGVLLTFSISLAGVIFKVGHTAARVEELERWKASIRTDMHEVSDKIDALSQSIISLKTLIEERTERRTFSRFPETTKS